jgi:NADH-quinone oxidoreductase subunit M
MIDATTVPWLLAAIPLLGALLGLAVWTQPEKLKHWSIVVTLLSLLSTIGTAWRLTGSAEGQLFFYLLPLAACISLLGQPVHREHRLAWIMTLLCLGFGLGILAGPPLIAHAVLTLLLALIAFLLYWHRNPFWGASWLGIGAYGLGALSAGTAALTGSSPASWLACAVLLPLVPFHHGYVAALTRLPGSLPSFTALLLPAIGLHGLAALMPAASEALIVSATVFALAGALYGAIKALAQSRIRLLLAYGSLSFFSILWWCVASSRTVTPQGSVFLGSVALVTSGLLMSWQVVRTRYGDDVDPRAVSGLASPMPRFAVLLSLLALAAMGLPPFGVFAGFIGLFFASSFTSPAAPLVIVAAWLAASWYLLEMVQRLLFGRQRSDLRYEDLRGPEFASLLMVVVIVLALGVAPATLFGAAPPLANVGVTLESVSWNR